MRYSPRFLALALIVLGGASRLLPHLANFTAVGALSLFAGARLDGWKAYAVPLVVLLSTNLALAGLYHYPFFAFSYLFVLAAFAVNVWIGSFLRNTRNPVKIATASILCAVQFYLLSNFGVWLGGNLYPLTLEGLLACYTAAIPFFGRTLAADLFYAGVLFGLFAFLEQRVARNTGDILPLRHSS